MVQRIALSGLSQPALLWILESSKILHLLCSILPILNSPGEIGECTTTYMKHVSLHILCKTQVEDDNSH